MRRHLVTVFALLVASTWAAEDTAAPPGTPADSLPAHLVKVLRTTNKAQTNKYVPKVYELKNVNPFDVMRFFRRVMEIEEGRFATYLAPDGKSGLVVLIAPEYQIPYLDKLMAIIDRPGLTSSSGDEGKYVRLKNRAADDLGLLRAVWSQAAHSPTGPTRGTRAGDLDLITDLETNAVFVYAPPSVAERVEAVLAELDVPLPQVLVEATIYEIDLNNDGAVGLDYYAWKNGPGRNLFAFGAFAEYESVDKMKGGVNLYDSGFQPQGMPLHRFRNHGYNYAYFLDVPSAYFDFLVAKGEARVVTTARILSKIPSNYQTGLNEFGQVEFLPDGQPDVDLMAPAVFRAADEILYYRIINGPSQRAGARPAPYMLDPYGDNPDYPDNRTLVGRVTPLAASGTTILGRTIAAVDVGTRLEVTPRVGAENVLLDLLLEVSSLVGFDGAGEPRISARRAVADVRMQNGEEVVFGGLDRMTRTQSTRKFPVLGSLPVVGWAFGGENSGVRKSIVVGVVRATRLPSGVPTEMKQVVEQAKGNQSAPLPADSFGFDQWLLGK